METKLIAEIGINHNGDLDIVKKMIDLAVNANCYAVKFQKRCPDCCVPENQRDKIKDTPWGKIKYIDYKKKIELNKTQYKEIDKYCKEKNIKWFASAWDLLSAEFLKDINCDIVKIPSAMLTNDKLLEYCRRNFKELHLSTGMSYEEEIEKAIHIANPDIIYHTNSVYPTPNKDANLGYLKWIQDHYMKDGRELGYSNHCWNLQPMISSVLLGAKWVEFHFTIDRTMWGSDQLSSIEPIGMFKLSKAIKEVEDSINFGYEPRQLYSGEEKKRESLRGS